MRRFTCGCLLACFLLLGCDAQCRDHDHDGLGANCEKGPDCNDDNPLLGQSCDASVPDCEADPVLEGCGCLSGEHSACYPADPATQDEGLCKAGEVVCVDGYFSSCDGSVLPTLELCNALDDDCDGITDEGVLSPCGGCNESCVGGVWGPPLEPFAASGALALTEAGELTLRRTARETRSLWVANTGEGTVSRVDTERVRELARYRTAGGNPTRVAVDHRGDAWVLDSAAQGRATLSKLAGDSQRCVAADGGSVRSSRGPGEVLPIGQDDCVLSSFAVGAAADDARSLSIDGARAPDDELAGNPWVGMAGAHEVLELDGSTGKVIRRVALPKFTPYVSAFDDSGVLWLVDRDGLLARVDPAQEAPKAEIIEVPLACYALESLAIDAQGTLLLSGASCESVISFDPARERFEEAIVPGLLTPRGIAVDGDDAWVVFTSGALGRITRVPLTVANTYELAQGKLSPYDANGISTDSRGRVWVVSAEGGKGGVGLVTAFDPVTEAVSAQLSVGLGPRAQGDMTGTALGGEPAPKGTISHVFAGCGHESQAGESGFAGRLTQWQRAHLGATTGRDARVRVQARWAKDEAALSDAKWVGLGTLPEQASPYAVDFPEGGVVELRLTLHADGALGAPRISRVGLEWTCPGPD